MTKQTGTASGGALPVLLRRMNERRVLDALARGGLMSRADLARHTGISRPTVSKSVGSLVSLGLVERRRQHGNKTGRPAPLYTLASDSVHVIGVSVRPDACRIASTGVDCRRDHQHAATWPTPARPAALLDDLAARVATIGASNDRRLLGVGVCVPAIVEPATGRIIDSAAMPALDGFDLAAKLARRCGAPVRVVSQPTGLCLAERWFDHAAALDHFVVIDATDRLVARLFTRGRALLSPRGRSGAIGRLPAAVVDHSPAPVPDTTLDDVACDAAFAAAVTGRSRRKLDPVAAVAAVRRDGHRALLDSLAANLAAAVVAAVQLYDHDAVFLHAVCLDAADDLIDRVADLAARRCDRRPLHRCAASIDHAPFAAVIDHLTHAGEPAA